MNKDTIDNTVSDYHNSRQDENNIDKTRLVRRIKSVSRITRKIMGYVSLVNISLILYYGLPTEQEMNDYNTVVEAKSLYNLLYDADDTLAHITSRNYEAITDVLPEEVYYPMDLHKAIQERMRHINSDICEETIQGYNCARHKINSIRVGNYIFILYGVLHICPIGNLTKRKKVN